MSLALVVLAAACTSSDVVATPDLVEEGSSPGPTQRIVHPPLVLGRGELCPVS